MQEMIDQSRQGAAERAAKAIACSRWEAGESAYDRTPAVYTAENIDSLKYDSASAAANLSKYLISESAKDGKVIALILNRAIPIASTSF